MDFIPAFRFVAAIVVFGLLFYIYNPIVTYLSTIMGVTASTSIWAQVIFFFFAALPAVALFSSGIKMFMRYQKKGGRR